MTLSYLRNIAFLLALFVVSIQCTNGTGEAVTTRFWDCCKPSCSWKEKAKFSSPVLTCNKADEPFRDFSAGTGCNGGTAYSCSDQQPWAVNDTFSYGFAGIFVMGHVEDFWCCACYQLNFTSGPVKGKSMIVQASNTAYDVTTSNRFSLAIPGGNTTSHDACANQFGVSQNVFGETNSGVKSIDDCENLPKAMQPGCRWRFDWFKDAQYPSATFARVICPAVLSDKTECKRDDDNEKATVAANAQIHSSSATNLSPARSVLAAATMLITGLLWA
ncbi:uncharacterized protein BDR25DRAFT_241221 [Lindgomyces ingoldianus]|uniref:Uncharacterized protein n=1 Tax=Lindgomyces ingoldianus TaxID=673940 RepID=A0ACB6QFI1_9PLEO|nr:uncharacterized protein BDR25DRAFT_241221 [Lindgomyces ingoldianus]KAF2464872.1 hypothetical protein BDR25DRAFT_241221 [Lindgomyces ingoldianus]